MKVPKLLIVLTGCLLWSQVSLPPTAAARHFAEWIEMFNRGQRSELLEFLEKSFPSGAERLERSLAARQQSGGFDLEKVEQSSATRISQGTRLRQIRALRTLRAELDERTRQDRFAGAVLLAKNGKAVFRQATSLRCSRTSTRLRPAGLQTPAGSASRRNSHNKMPCDAFTLSTTIGRCQEWPGSGIRGRLAASVTFGVATNPDLGIFSQHCGV